MNNPPPPRNASEALSGALGDVPRVALREIGSEFHETPVVKPQSTLSTLGGTLPELIGPYLIAGEIAHGGVGVVLKARDVDLGRDIALKVLHPRHLGNADLVRRFVEEAQIGGQLQHPGILPVHGMGVLPDGRPYLAMKLVKGRTLAALLEDRRDPGEDRQRLLGIFEQVCQTLAYAHARRVVHRDLKPANVMVGSFGEVQLMDWGLAKVLSRPESAPAPGAAAQSIISTIRSTDGSSQSLVGSILGTPAYMAPEQARGMLENVDERSDVFGLGAILCEILTGQPPYHGASREQILEQARKGYLDNAWQRLDVCGTPELAALARRALAFESRDRPHSAGSVAHDINAYLDSGEERRRRLSIEAAEARARAIDESRARRLLLGLSAAAALLLTCAAWTWRAIDREHDARQLGALTATRDAIALTHKRLGEARAAGASRELSWEALQAQWRQAAEAAEEARRRSLLGAPAEVQAEAAELSAGVGDESARVRGEALRRERNRRLLERLEEIRLASYAHLDGSIEHADYRAAFDEIGLDLEGADVETAARSVEAIGMSADVADAMTRWAWAARSYFGPRSALAPKLQELAERLDPDPGRRRYRQSVNNPRLRELQSLAAEARGKRVRGSMLELLAESLLTVGGSGRAVVLLDEALRTDPARASLHFLRNRAAAGDTVALESWIPALSLRPRDGSLIGWMGRVQSPIPERHWCEEGVRLKPRDPLLLASMGRVLVGHADTLHEAQSWLLASLALNPYAQPVWHNYALTYFHRGEYEEAIRLYQRALRDHRHPLTLDNLGYALEIDADLDGALAATAEAISRRSDGGTAPLHLRIARILDRKGDAAGAAAHQRAAQLLDPRNGDAWLERGALLARHGRVLEALGQIQQGLEKGAADEKAYHGACSILVNLRLPEPDVELHRALDALATTIRRSIAAGTVSHPRWHEALLRLHELRLEGLPPEQALSDAREIAARGRGVPVLQALPGLVLWRSGARREAIATLEAAADSETGATALNHRLDELRRDLAPDLATFASIDAALEAPRSIVRELDRWRFFRGLTAPSPGKQWVEAEFDDSGWEEGPGGFGYGDGDDNTVLEDMQGRYRALYLRKRFDLPALWPGDRVELRVRADDGFIAHVNGRRAGAFHVLGMLDGLNANGIVVQDHEAVDADILDITSLCRRGTNQLAIIGLNSTISSSDMTLAPEVTLIAEPGAARAEQLLAGLRSVASGDDVAARTAYLEGHIHQLAGRSAEAAEAFERSSSLAPAAGEPLERLLALRDAAGRGAEAIEALGAAFRAGAHATPALLARWVAARRQAGVAWNAILATWPRRADDYHLVLVPRSTAARSVSWRYTTEWPAAGWNRDGVADAEWAEGAAPFGVRRSIEPELTRPQTRWSSPDIWLRRRFTCDLPLPLPPGLSADVVLHIAHDDAAEVYLNGVELARRSRYSNEYTRSVTRGTGFLRQGENVVAVHCHNQDRDGLIDVEVVLRIASRGP